MVAVDLGGSNMRVALVGPGGNIFSRETHTIDRDNVLKQLVDLVGMSVNEYVVGIGVSIPGAIKPGDLVWTPNISGWTELPLKKILKDRFDPLAVTVKDDRASMVFGESRFGVAKGFKNVVYVIVGTGVGAGLMLDGRVYSGTRGLAGSIGWFVTDEGEETNKMHGTFEEEVAGPSIERKTGTNGTRMMEMAKRGDVEALGVFESIGRKLGSGIANLVSVTDPEMVVIGGGVSESWKFIEKGVRNSMRKWAHPILKDIPILRSSLGDNAGILGVSQMVMEEVDG